METRIVKINPNDLKLLELNARYMRHEAFQRLVANIRDDAALTSVPFACREEDGKYLVLSGNHRVKAAIAAGLDEIPVMVTDEQLSRDRKIAIQLSHNAIAGEDDPAILKELYESIGQVDFKVYAGLDDKTLELLDKVSIESFSEPHLKYQTITMLFLPDELEEARKTFEEVKALLSGNTEVWVTRWSEYDKWLDILEATGASYGIKNVATTVMVMMDLSRNHITDLQQGYLYPNGEPIHNGWIPMETLFGQSKIPAQAAAVVKRAIDKMVGAGDIEQTNLWQAIEYLAADYLSKA
ncbi:MAG: ParB/RepB/Spo0J family partition protein [Dehalococcoidia bacterium]|nr:ParB/RepB/Spo0J family partition protein [Dehalococcoidia bacterium]